MTSSARWPNLLLHASSSTPTERNDAMPSKLAAGFGQLAGGQATRWVTQPDKAKNHVLSARFTTRLRGRCGAHRRRQLAESELWTRTNLDCRHTTLRRIGIGPPARNRRQIVFVWRLGCEPQNRPQTQMHNAKLQNKPVKPKKGKKKLTWVQMRANEEVNNKINVNKNNIFKFLLWFVVCARVSNLLILKMKMSNQNQTIKSNSKIQNNFELAM